MNNDSSKKEELQFFDAEWYLQENPDIATKGVEPLSHFLTYGWKEGRNPSKHFDVKKYIKENPEIVQIGINPFDHISISNSNSTSVEFSFPVDAIETSQVFKPLDKEKKYKRVYIVASFLSDGIIPEYLLYLLSKIKKTADAIILIGDNPIKIDELKKLSKLVNYTSFARHEEYDFGSYKRGIEFVAESIDLHNVEELVLCNDSCVGPIFPVADMFAAMEEKNVDFWGITSNYENCFHLQSYFLVFNNKVINDPLFFDYFRNVKKEPTRERVILKYELPLTSYLKAAGYVCDSYIPYPDEKYFTNAKIKHPNITTIPIYMFENKSPFIKLKHFYDSKLNFDGIEVTCNILSRLNPNLAEIIFRFIKNRKVNKPLQQSNIGEKLTKEKMLYLRLTAEVENYKNKLAKKTYKFRESQIVHEYLDGLNGIEIGASSHNSFGLDKTGGYANVDYKASHGDLWQSGSALAPAKVNIVASGDELPFKDESLDYVISSHALEHFFDPIKTIEEWFRVVRKNGYVVMIIPHKERTFDKLRPVTSVHELIARNKNILTEEKYFYRTDVEESDNLILPYDFLRIIENDEEKVENYKPIRQDIDIAHLHLSVWDTETFVELCKKMQWNIKEVQDVDDKVGNGFLVILQK